MKKVTKIGQNTADVTEKSKLRVAAYCRVSTESDKQLESLDTQIKHYETYIKANPEWVFVGLYYDEGITGTKKEKRPEAPFPTNTNISRGRSPAGTSH